MAKPTIITGDKKLDRKLAGLEPKLQKKGLRKALREGAKQVQQEAKALCPVDTGALKKSIKVRAAKGLGRGNLGVNVIVQDPEQFPKAAVVEYGNETHPPQSYMRAAKDNKGEDARQYSIERLKEILDDIVKQP